MRNRNRKLRHLTPRDKRRIRKLTLARVGQSEIARIMRIGRDTIAKWQVRLGLPTRLPIPEKRIMRLFRLGWGGYRIARHLRIAVSAVYKVAHKNNFRRKDGIGYPEPHGDIAGFVNAVKLREGYIKSLARRYGVGFVKARRLAHEILECPEFRPGLSKPPLSSNFPQKYFPAGILTFEHLAQRILCKTFDGAIPAAATAEIYCDAVMEACPDLKEAPRGVKRVFAENLLAALQSQIAMRSVPERAWLN